MTTYKPLTARELKEMKKRAALSTEPRAIMLPNKPSPETIKGLQSILEQSEARRLDLERCIAEIERLNGADQILITNPQDRHDSDKALCLRCPDCSTYMRLDHYDQVHRLDCGKLESGRDTYAKGEIDRRFKAITDLLELIPTWAEEDDSRVTKHQDFARKAMKLEERAWRKAVLDFLTKSATFMDFDHITNGNQQRLQLIEDLRNRFLPSDR